MSGLRLQLAGGDREAHDQLRRRVVRSGVTLDVTDRLSDLPDALIDPAPDVLLLDADDEPDAVLDALSAVKQLHPELPVILFAGDADMPLVVDAMRVGAFDFVAKPLDYTRLDIVLKNASQLHRLMQRVNQLQEKHTKSGSFQNLVGQSAPMRHVYDVVEHVSRTDVTVFLTGESGTGKELVAQAIHDLSERRRRDFVVVDCASIPTELMDSEVFGHEAGALPEATSRYAGLAERADGGTLFFDEVCDLPEDVQSKMLRFLEEGTFHRMGGTEAVAVDVRVIAATNRDPRRAMEQGRLREDLFYRLNVVPVELPPLRGRRGDVPLLANHFLERFSNKYGKYFYDLSPEAMERLQAYGWPGNVRELANVIERAVVLNNASQITARMLPGEILDGRKAAAGAPHPAEHGPAGDEIVPFTAIEEREIRRALRICGYNVAQAAERLQLGQATLYRKVKKYDIHLNRGERETVKR